MGMLKKFMDYDKRVRENNKKRLDGWEEKQKEKHQQRKERLDKSKEEAKQSQVEAKESLKEAKQDVKDAWRDRPKGGFKDAWDEGKKSYYMEKGRQQAEQEKPSDQDKFYKNANTIIKGAALWYLIPFLGVMAIVGVFVVVWLLGVIGIM